MQDGSLDDRGEASSAGTNLAGLIDYPGDDGSV
jgi:hypothetical protein